MMTDAQLIIALAGLGVSAIVMLVGIASGVWAVRGAIHTNSDKIREDLTGDLAASEGRLLEKIQEGIDASKTAHETIQANQAKMEKKQDDMSRDIDVLKVEMGKAATHIRYGIMSIVK